MRDMTSGGNLEKQADDMLKRKIEMERMLWKERERRDKRK